uniref:Contactin-associated protein-like 4 n=1 Tax=Oncorhynchus kisutch TaxID=8019 RepID=A0A8C7CJ10_ONCKI
MLFSSLLGLICVRETFPKSYNMWYLCAVFPAGAGGWAPVESNKYQWLEVDLGERTEITAVATQGRYGSSDWVSSFLLMFSDTGCNWKQYRQEDNIRAFTGNSNADSVVQFKLQQPVFARFLRLLPLDWNPNGRIGLRLEAYGCPYSKYNQWSLTGHHYPLTDMGNSLTSPRSISPLYKVYIMHSVFRPLDFFHILLRYSLILKLIELRKKNYQSTHNSHMVVSLGSLLDDQHWHHVAIERFSGHLNFTVDKSSQQIQVRTCWNINFGLMFFHKISYGGVQCHGSQRVMSRRNFHGCLENLLWNDVNVIDLAKQQQQVSITGNVTFTCAEPVSVPVTFAGAQSFLQLPGAAQQQRDGGGVAVAVVGVAISLQFRTWNRAGLLLTFDLQQQAGSLWLYLSEARVRLQIHKAGRYTILVDVTAGFGLNDGQWHSVDLIARRGHLTITVDKEEDSTAHASPSFPECRNPFNVFQGCMRHIHVDNNAVDLIKVQQMLIGNYSDLQIDMCGIIDRCSPSHCEHGGRCTQSWSTFHCNCSNTGYSGATCHSSVYEKSCEAYKHQGNTSGLYYIDVDGSGPIKSQLIYCNMTDKTWLVIQHNNTELTKLKASSGINQHLAYFNYSADAEQLWAIITQAEHCEQEVLYHCRKSLLLNTPDGSPFTWWVGRTDEPQTYWGGAVPGSQQCGCGLQGNCIDSDHYCNCDADRKEWATDSGLLTHKENLPVRWVVVGDIQRPGSEAAYKVGPLKCHGDKNFWNAAFFNKETSYLHFPTFHGELSADISFLFKTTAASGVFLENLGIKDFIRVELSSPTEVVFSFDVGNGPFEVRVETGDVALNDDRWHRVRAERNVKEASLRVDAFPNATQKAPADGHIHLQLNSQLFVGGTASRMKGFLGCIRSLQLNGRTLDLEERAKITPGVRPGCPGHCSSYGELCQNQGRCVEMYNGFSCDCGLSAYAGPFCQREVSADFKPGTSVQYTFKEPYELNRNISTQSSSIYSDLKLRGENVSFSFRSSQSPALLLYVSSYYREYLAVLLNRNGYLDVKYKLQNSRDAEVFRTSVRNLANGQLHRVSIRRLSETVSVQVIYSLTVQGIYYVTVQSGELDPEIARLNSQGFSGCLSVVQFNSVAPLKAALLYPNTSPVIVIGSLAESTCGSSSPVNPYPAETTHSLSGKRGGVKFPMMGGVCGNSVIAVVIFVILCALAIMARFLYRRKETFHTQEPQGIKPEADSPEYPFHSEPNSQNILSENQKEYFI